MFMVNFSSFWTWITWALPFLTENTNLHKRSEAPLSLVGVSSFSSLSTKTILFTSHSRKEDQKVSLRASIMLQAKLSFLISFKLSYYFMYMDILFAYTPCTHGGQEWESDPLELELQLWVIMWLLGVKLGPPEHLVAEPSLKPLAYLFKEFTSRDCRNTQERSQLAGLGTLGQWYTLS